MQSYWVETEVSISLSKPLDVRQWRRLKPPEGWIKKRRNGNAWRAVFRRVHVAWDREVPDSAPLDLSWVEGMHAKLLLISVEDNDDR